MSAPASLQTLIGRYVVERRRLGFEATDALYLNSLARHLRSVKHKGPLTLEVMADWARHRAPTAARIPRPGRGA